MAKVTSAFGRPIQGVSQQPNKVRRDGQCSLQENMNPSVVEGLKVRPGTRSIAKLMSTAPTGTKVHHYRRGDDEEYFVVIRPNSLPLVFNEKGEQQVVIDETVSNAYVKNSNPKLNLETITISDFTFIVNRTVPVSTRAERSPTLVNEALLYVQFATYGKYYQVIVDGVIAGQFQAPSGELPEHVFQVDTTKVASALVNGGEIAEFEDSFVLKVYDPGIESQVYATLPPGAITFTGSKNQPDFIVNNVDSTFFVYNRDSNAPPGEPDLNYTFPYPGSSLSIGYAVSAAGLINLPGFLITQTGNVVHIRKQDGSDFEIETIDGADGGDLVALKGLLTDIGKLPPYAPDGFTIKIQNSGRSDDTGYWLRAVDRGGNTVKWAESIAPDVLLGFNKSTMPYTLIRESLIGGVATFKLKEGAWEDRDVGDDFSNPFPDFVDSDAPKALQTIGVFQNRLFVTAGESVSMSRSGEFFNFGRQTTQVLADSDPVGGFADSNQINSLTNAVTLDGDLIMFSRNAQFKISGREIITNQNFTVSQTNSFESIEGARPVASGEAIFFAFINGKFSGIREYFTDSLTDTKRARPVTEHVDKYISGPARSLATSPNTNWLLVTADEMNVIYVYNWLWLGDERAQSAWHKWVFPEGTEVVSMHFSQDKLYLLIKRYDELWLEAMEVNDNADPIIEFEVRLDRQVVVQGSRELVDGRYIYSFPDPYPEESLDDLAFVCGENCYPEYIGARIGVERNGGGIVTTEEELGDSDTFSVIVGRKYLARYIPSEPVIKDYRDRVIGTDELMLSRYFINYESTGRVAVSVKGKYGPARQLSYTGRVLGSPDNIVGFKLQPPGQFVVPVMQRASSVTIEISTDDHVPFELRDIEWSGQFNQRGRRV